MYSIGKLRQKLLAGGYKARWAFLAHYIKWMADPTTRPDAQDLWDDLQRIWHEQDDGTLPATRTKEDRDLTSRIMDKLLRAILWHGLPYSSANDQHDGDASCPKKTPRQLCTESLWAAMMHDAQFSGSG